MFIVTIDGIFFLFKNIFEIALYKERMCDTIYLKII